MDEKLRHILKEKLDAHESAVPGHLWEKVSAQAGSSSISVFGQAKWFIAAAISAGAIGFAVWFGGQPKTEDAYTHAESTTLPNTQQPVEKPTEKRESVENTASANAWVNIETSKTAAIAAPTNPTTQITTDTQPVTMEETMSITNAPSETHTENPAVTPAAETNITPEYNERKQDSFSAVQINRFDMAYFFIPTNPKAEQYRWEFGDGAVSDEMSPQHTYDEPGVYNVRLHATALGVTNTINQTIECLPASQLHVPTIFTPNGDGKNDLFDILTLSKFIEITEFRVFDEKGNLVYSSENGEAWNGVTPSGIVAPEGNYLYQIQALDLRQQPVEKSGIIYLRR